MEPATRYRKRKQRPSESDPFGGIFTRSKSQIYFHRHRSGYARGDSNRSRHLFKSQEGTAKLVEKLDSSEAAVDQVTGQVSVKDLRARRVFSPATSTENVASVGDVDLESELDVHKKNDVNPNVVDSASEIDAGHGDLSVPDSAAVDLKAGSELVVDLSENDACHGDLGVPDSAAVDLKANSESVIDSSAVRESHAVEADDVQMTPAIAESSQIKRPEEKHHMINVATGNTDTSVAKSQSLVTTLRARRKVFKSPSSFSYRRLLPYLINLENDDSSSVEIVEGKMPKKEEIGPVSGSIKLADGSPSNPKSDEKEHTNSVNPDSVSTVEVSDVVNDPQEEFEQMTPPDSDIYSTSKIKTIMGIPVKPTSKPVLKSCSRLKALQTPTSFSHRRLLPFLMSVVGDDSWTSKGDQVFKTDKATEQSQEPPTNSLMHQSEKLDSSTSTLNLTDTGSDITKTVTPVSSDMLLDANESDKECSGSISQLEVHSQVEAVKSDGGIKLEQSPPKTVMLASSEILSDANGPDKECRGSIPQLEVNSQVEAVKSDSYIKAELSPPKTVTLASSVILSDVDGPGKESSGSISPFKSNLQLDAVESDSCIKSEQSPPKNSLRCVEEVCNTTLSCIEQGYSNNNHKSVIETQSESLLQITPLNTIGAQPVNVKSGILKRTPRGCRGICNCLNCTSFRLHAERSFEFSRNQLHDAEELALELINDLTCVRNVLEGIASDSGCLDTVKEKQAKEACAKALYKEQAARAQLAQMNEDLSFHCRSMISLRPKVTFANKIEEKVVPRSV